MEKKLVFEPFEKVGNLVFGMTRENAVEICGEIKRSRMYGYPIEDSFLDDFGDVHILCNKKGFLEAIELFPDMATETYSLFYHGTEVVLCIDIDLLVSQIRNITDDLKLDDAIVKFENGMKLSKECNKKLEEAEKRITILLKNADDVTEEDFVAE